MIYFFFQFIKVFNSDRIGLSFYSLESFNVEQDILLEKVPDTVDSYTGLFIPEFDEFLFDTDGYVCIYDLVGKEVTRRKKIHERCSRNMTLIDPYLILTSSWDGSFAVHDYFTFNTIYFDDSYSNRYVRGLAYKRKVFSAITSSEDGTIRVYDLHKLKKSKVWSGFGYVYFVEQFDTNSDIFYSTCSDGNVRMHDLREDEVVQTHSRPVYPFGITPSHYNPYHLVIGDGNWVGKMEVIDVRKFSKVMYSELINEGHWVYNGTPLGPDTFAILPAYPGAIRVKSCIDYQDVPGSKTISHPGTNLREDVCTIVAYPYLSPSPLLTGYKYSEEEVVRSDTEERIEFTIEKFGDLTIETKSGQRLELPKLFFDIGVEKKKEVEEMEFSSLEEEVIMKILLECHTMMMMENGVSHETVFDYYRFFHTFGMEGACKKIVEVMKCLQVDEIVDLYNLSKKKYRPLYEEVVVWVHSNDNLEVKTYHCLSKGDDEILKRKKEEEERKSMTSFSETLKKLYDRKEEDGTVDLVTRDGEKTKCHIEVLCLFSNFFHRMLRFGGREMMEWKKEGKVELVNWSKGMLEKYLEWIYLGRIESEEEMKVNEMIEFLVHAQIYDEKKFFHFLFSEMKKWMGGLYSQGKSLFKDEILKIIDENYDHLLNSKIFKVVTDLVSALDLKLVELMESEMEKSEVRKLRKELYLALERIKVLETKVEKLEKNMGKKE